MERYTPVSMEEIKDLLKEDKGWVLYNPTGAEAYLDFTIKSLSASYPVVIRVHTSIASYGTISRDCGADAIRVSLVLLDPKRPGGISKFKRVHRTKNWSENLRKRVTEALFYAKNKLRSCPKCGRVMLEKTNKKNNDKFLGCSGYPEFCQNTQRIS